MPSPAVCYFSVSPVTPLQNCGGKSDLILSQTEHNHVDSLKASENPPKMVWDVYELHPASASRAKESDAQSNV